MNGKSRLIVSVIIGIISGGFISQLVQWQAVPKAFLAAGVAAIVTGILLFVLPKRKE